MVGEGFCPTRPVLRDAAAGKFKVRLGFFFLSFYSACGLLKGVGVYLGHRNPQEALFFFFLGGGGGGVN